MLDVRMEEAATMSGARSLQTLFRVTLPILRPAILSTILLLFVRGIESFEVPRLIGNPARINVFTTEVQRATSQSTPEFGVASALARSSSEMLVATDAPEAVESQQASGVALPRPKGKSRRGALNPCACRAVPPDPE
jgi:iron(III) transport system permease protein